AMAFLGMAFGFCALLIIGLPPTSAFIGKFALLSAALQTSATDTPSIAAWSLVVGMLGSGLAGIIALSRTGIRLFWSSEETITPRLRISEAAPVGLLILATIALAFWAGPVMHHMEQTASYLDRPSSYVNAVLTQSPGRAVTPGAGQ